MTEFDSTQGESYTEVSRNLSLEQFNIIASNRMLPKEHQTPKMMLAHRLYWEEYEQKHVHSETMHHRV